MKSILKNTLTGLLKSYYGSSIVRKPYNGTASYLYYEPSQHLLFSLKREIRYEPIIQEKIKKYIPSGGLVFDIGGNIGQYALFFSERVGSGGQVISCEPDSKNYAFLQFNVMMNHLQNVSPLRRGVSSKVATLEFFRDTETGGRKGSFRKEFVEENFRGFTETVQTVTIDALIDSYGVPDFVKIDVEGFEDDIINGLTRPLDKTVFLVEVRQETKAAVLDYFQRRGYRCLHVDEKQDRAVSSPEELPRFADLLFVKSA